MTKKQFAFALGAAACCAANATSQVEIYGVVDLGIDKGTNTAFAVGAHKVF